MTKSAQRQFLVSVSGVSGYFASKSGGNVSAEANKVWNGGSLVPDVIAGPPELENVTISRPYDRDLDNELVKNLRNGVGRSTHTLTVTPTNQDMVAVGSSTVYPNALLVGVKDPEVDASSSEAATFELEFAVPTVR